MLFDTFLPALVVFLLVVAGMAIGVIVSNRRITGSCGGLSAIPGADRCGVCGRDLREASDADCNQRKLSSA
ncbi:MAG: (Na+)-NQR maturation NqrM [Pseudomonadota bacterium]